MIIYSMDYPFSFKALLDGGLLIVISLAVMALSGAVALIFVKSIKVDKLAENIFVFSIFFSNFTFMGIPIIFAIYGKEGIFYTSIFIVVIRLLFNTLGIMVMQRGSITPKKRNPGNILNPPIIAVLAGIIIFTFSIHIPKPVSLFLGSLAATMTPFGTIIVGLQLAEENFAGMFNDYRVYLVSFIRLVLLPLITYSGLKMFQLNPMIVGIPVVITAMPVAASVAMLADKFNGNTYLGSQCVFISTILAIFTIPFIVLLVTRVS